jgi:hypothetical protein
MRSRTALALAALLLVLAAALSACGGSGSQSAAKALPGSPENPIESGAVDDGTDPDAPDRSAPGYRDIVDAQTHDPARRDSPCALVTKSQAQAIVGGKLLDPLEAPQGPTCIYRDRAGTTFVTLAVQKQRFRALRKDVKRIRRVNVADHPAYCGVYGAPTLYLPLKRDRVLSVTAQCEVAMRFARSAVPRLDS